MITVFCLQHSAHAQYRHMKEVLLKLSTVLLLLLIVMLWQRLCMLDYLTGKHVLKASSRVVFFVLFLFWDNIMNINICILVPILFSGWSKKLIVRLGRILNPGYKLESWIFMALSVSRITGQFQHQEHKTSLLFFIFIVKIYCTVSMTY